jgi:hypothetical protein
MLEGGAALTIRRAESVKSCYFIDSARSAITECMSSGGVTLYLNKEPEHGQTCDAI